MFKPVDPKQNFPQLEAETLRYWKSKKTFEKSVNQRPKSKEYIFYDGPPFATGLPHYGHLLAGTMKDVVPRYWAMRGKRVERRFGWDCHGLPVEYEVEKELGLSGRKDIVDKYGVYEFCEKCRSIVLRYTQKWEETVNRMGRWVDFKNDYKTMDPTFMESIWWVFGELWKKKLVYQGHKAMHICPRCVTPLSNFEVTLGYKDVTDLSVTAKFRVKERKNTYILAWTTTPWTLPGNMALAVGNTIDYGVFEEKETRDQYIMSKVYFSNLKLEEKEKYALKETVKGKSLVGLSYEPLFDFYKKDRRSGAEKWWYIHHADFVATEEGTGVVHTAGGFGEDDMKFCEKAGLPIIVHVGMDGNFTKEVTPWAGKFVKTQEQNIAADLEKSGLLFKRENYRHSYPHCWRCESPLLNYATSSWFVKVEQIKKQMIAANKKVHWVPEHVGTKRFGDWLENARDWCVSRNRFWGTPLPIWVSEDGKDFICVFSIKDLEKRTGKKVIDLHKHKIDSFTFKEKGKLYRRIPDVFDCWFEAGSMPYAQTHYPFEGKAKFEKDFPAEFIAEGLDQTRGWFYTLMVLGVALFGKAPFQNVIVNGLILAEDGKKMSKRLKNYPEPGIILDKYGADALRFYLMNSPAVKAEPLCFSEKGVENVVKNVILPIWNAYSFLVTYSNIDKWKPAKSAIKKPKNKLDRWILSELHALLKEVTEEMDGYNLQATRPLYQFADNLTNWYIRRSRRRFWKNENDQDKKEGYQTLYTVLATLSQIMAPVMPLLSEAMYQNLAGGESVHLTDWPKFQTAMIDKKLNQEIELAIQIAKLGNAARGRAKIKNRQPLSRVQVGLPDHLRKFLKDDQLEVLREELNVKKIEITDDPSSIAKAVVHPNPKILGPKFGKDVQFILKEAKAGNFELLENGNIKIDSFELTPEEFNMGYESKPGMDVESDHGIIVALDTAITPSLKREGMARDLIRTIQDLRKEADYKVDDRIEVSIEAVDEIKEAIEEFKNYIATETLANNLSLKPLTKPDKTKIVEWENGKTTEVRVKR